MNRHLLLLLFFLIPDVLSAQDNTFEYYRKGKYIQMSSGKTIIGFDPYKSIVSGTKERMILSKGISYRLVIQKGNSDKVKTLVNSKDSVLATIFLSGDNRNSILLPDGRLLKREEFTSGKWSYNDNGQEVITYSAKKDGKFSRVKLSCNDNTVPMDVLQIICLEHSAEILYSNPTALMIGVGLGLALVRVAIASGG